MSIKELYDIFRSHPRISTDSRNITESSLYFALRGDRFNGNLFAEEALSKGAAYAIVDDKSLKIDPANSQRIIIVDDALKTLQALARHHRQVLSIPIIAITGSNGKTTTKELITASLATKYRVYSTRGNLNNHIGVPLTLLEMTPSTEIGVVEMGANAQGEIALLCSIAQPSAGIITNVGRAHLEGFGGEEGIRRGKGELFDYLQSTGGEAFFAQEDGVISQMAESRNGLNIVDYSTNLSNGIQHSLEGEYNLKNIAAAVAIAQHYNTAREDIDRAIAAYRPTNNRSQLQLTPRNRLIVDCYNANPSSMDVAITNLATDSYAEHSKKMMILGDMFELGEWSTQEHQNIVRRAEQMPHVRTVLVGEEFSQSFKTLHDAEQPSNIEIFNSTEELLRTLPEIELKGYTILIKGSRAMALEKIINIL
ncbi:MAG: UDP-N-acetylmuramoyl-tripeptide--D-alanyl-D-alanine ligase [Rikenellaceae bacterium]